MLNFIVNPTAGGKNGKKIKSTITLIEQQLKARNVDYFLHFTSHKCHAKTLTQSLIKQGSTDLIVVGGDGTLHEVINGFSCFEKVNLGLIPCGTGNDFATAVGIPLDPISALEIILSQPPKFVDFMQMGDIRGINIIGTGIDVDVLRRYNKLKKKNKFNYTWCLIKTLFNFKYIKFKAKIDDNEKDYHAFIACIANGSVYGGGIPICPLANPTDNQLNFVSVKTIPKLKIIGAFIKLKKGKILNLNKTEHFNCDKVEILTDEPCVVNVDGELYENVPFNVEIVKNTLRMYRK